MRGAIISACALLVAGGSASAQTDGAKLYARCAACHLSTGAGVPGAFPPLNADVRALANAPEGRRYLIMAVVKGLSGPITVEGKSYRGMMPAQGGMNDAQVAAVLTHVTGTVARTGKVPEPFTAAEVAAVRAATVGLTAAAVARAQPKVAGR